MTWLFFPGYLRGLDVIAETSILVTKQAQTFHWAGYGLKLHIPQGALPANLEKCRFLIKVCLSGQLIFPKNSFLMSAVYWLDSEPQCKFSQLVTVEIQHCLKPTHVSKLSFAHANCSQKQLPYVFEVIGEGVFSSESACGSVQRAHFCLLGIICNPFARFYNMQRYCASLYYLKKGANWIIHFVISKDLKAHTTVSFMQVHSFVEYCCYSWLWLQFVEQKYTTKGCISGPSQRVEFEANTISLELPSMNTILSDGWKIIPLIRPEVKPFYMHYWTELQYMEYIIICKFSDH